MHSMFLPYLGWCSDRSRLTGDYGLVFYFPARSRKAAFYGKPERLLMDLHVIDSGLHESNMITGVCSDISTFC